MITLLEHGLDALGWVNVVTALLVCLAGWAAWKKTVASTSQEIYKRVAQAYKAEVEALQERMRLLEQENQSLKALLETIKRSLARRGLRVTEEGRVEKRPHSDDEERAARATPVKNGGTAKGSSLPPERGESAETRFPQAALAEGQPTSWSGGKHANGEG